MIVLFKDEVLDNVIEAIVNSNKLNKKIANITLTEREASDFAKSYYNIYDNDYNSKEHVYEAIKKEGLMFQGVMIVMYGKGE